ncbi:MAG: cytoskeletal protein CcmA (bactofilin family) [Vicingaceae bacterium]|jgi:cytoskeletal protein CcmA (bactofilin family)
MFKRKSSTMARNNEIDSSAINHIRLGTEITGDINCKEGIRIDGKLVGNLKCAGKIVVGESGLIEGTIECANAIIEGDIKGSTIVNELLTLKATSNLVGDITTNKLQIEPGANFSGSCKMGAVIKGIENGSRKNSKEKTA